MAFESTFRPGAQFTAMVTAGFGAFAGVFVGAANGSVILGLLIGAVLMGAIAYGAISQSLPEAATRWGLVVIFALVGVIAGWIGGLTNLIITHGC